MYPPHPHSAQPRSASPPSDEEDARRTRATVWLLVLGGTGVAVLVVAIVLIVSALHPDTATSPFAPAPGGADGWDLAAEQALATAPMLALPDAAAAPHELSTAAAGPPIAVPGPTQTAGRLVPGGFPATPEGALGQLAALTTAGFAGVDPQVYENAYRSVALPGAPAANTTRLSRDMTLFRGRNSLPERGPAPQLTGSTYRVLQGQIKGVASGGRYVVACVIGELTVTWFAQQSATTGGDCQALRFVDGNWQIAPGAAAAPAPLAWPGSAEAAAAGYRTLTVPAGGGG